ncbi:MAG: hypothetical protein JOZ36_15460 [Acidobacteria bacterium]|nr:hypothetical protein [Acidobacteriota bacterium]
MTSAAALGMRVHSGWAALVALSGPDDSPCLIDRRILPLANPNTAGSKQPYHAVRRVPFPAAQAFLAQAVEETNRLASRGLMTTIEELQRRGFNVAGCGLPLKRGRTLPSLERILASHAFIHTAEGQLFRHALAQAAAECDLPVTDLEERELLSQAAVEIGSSIIDIERQLAAMGRTLGPPWREDQRYATLAAWITLAATRKCHRCTPSRPIERYSSGHL